MVGENVGPYEMIRLLGVGGMGEVYLARDPRPDEAQSDYWAYFASAGGLFRDGLARTYLAQGEKEKAAEALEGLLQSGHERLSHPVLYVQGLYKLGVLKNELGDEPASRKYLESYLEHWEKADRDLTEVRDARRRLAR